MAARETSRAECAPVAGGGRSDLWPGEKKLLAAQAGAGDPCDAAWNSRSSQSRPTGIRLLGKIEHGFYRAGESDRTPWRGGSGKTDLGHFSTSSPAAGLSGMVASVLPFCPS